MNTAAADSSHMASRSTMTLIDDGGMCWSANTQDLAEALVDYYGVVDAPYAPYASITIEPIQGDHDDHDDDDGDHDDDEFSAYRLVCSEVAATEEDNSEIGNDNEYGGFLSYLPAVSRTGS